MNPQQPLFGNQAMRWTGKGLIGHLGCLVQCTAAALPANEGPRAGKRTGQASRPRMSHPVTQPSIWKVAPAPSSSMNAMQLSHTGFTL